jgi:hypothetical protein
MTKVDFNSSTISAIHSAVYSKNKWVTTGLKVVDKDNGFVRFIKIIFLPMARVFGKDTFSHVRANEVALVIFAAFQNKKDTLAAEDIQKVYQILEKLNQKTGSKYVVLGVLIPVVKKLAPDTPAFTSNVTGTLSFVKKDTPTPPPLEGFEAFKKKAETPKAVTETDSQPKPVKDASHEVFEKATKIKSHEVKYITNMLDNPFFRQRFKTEVEDFMEAIEYANPDDSGIEVEDASISSTHPFFGRFFKEFKETPSAERGKWIKATLEYLEDEILSRLAKVKEIKTEIVQANTIKNQELQAQAAKVEEQKKQDSIQVKKEEMAKEIFIDPATFQKIVKKNLLYQQILLPHGFTSVREYQKEHGEVLNWIHNGGDLSDKEMLERHDILRQIASQWMMKFA